MPVFTVYDARVCVHGCVGVYDQSDRWWTALVMDFIAYWAALPTGGCMHRLLAECSCNMRDAVVTCRMPGRASRIREACSHDGGRGRRTVTGVMYSIVTGHEMNCITGGMEMQ